jgi:hypothetical protein
MSSEKDIESNLNIIAFIKNNQITNKEKIKTAFNKFKTTNKVKNSTILKKIINLIIKYNYNDELKIDLLVMLGIKKLNLETIALNENQLINIILKENDNNSELIISNIMEHLIPSLRDTLIDKHKQVIIDTINKNIEEFQEPQYYKLNSNEKDEIFNRTIEIDGHNNPYELTETQYKEFIDKLKGDEFFTLAEMIQALNIYEEDNNNPALQEKIKEINELTTEVAVLEKKNANMKNKLNIKHMLTNLIKEKINEYLKLTKSFKEDEKKDIEELLKKKLNEINKSVKKKEQKQTVEVQYAEQPDFNRSGNSENSEKSDNSDKPIKKGLTPIKIIIILSIIISVIFIGIIIINYNLFNIIESDNNIKTNKEQNINNGFNNKIFSRN